MSRAYALSGVAFVFLLGTGVGCTGASATAGGDIPPATTPAPVLKNVVTSAMLADAGDASIERVIADHIAGVRLDRSADGYLMLRIRGTTSWTTDAQPLYVLDGMPLTTNFGGPLSGINKLDIERIQVLKDAASTALYGVRGASGVVVIETKKP